MSACMRKSQRIPAVAFQEIKWQCQRILGVSKSEGTNSPLWEFTLTCRLSSRRKVVCPTETWANSSSWISRDASSSAATYGNVNPCGVQNSDTETLRGVSDKDCFNMGDPKTVLFQDLIPGEAASKISCRQAKPNTSDNRSAWSDSSSVYTTSAKKCVKTGNRLFSLPASSANLKRFLPTPFHLLNWRISLCSCPQIPPRLFVMPSPRRMRRCQVLSLDEYQEYGEVYEMSKKGAVIIQPTRTSRC